MMHLMRLCCLLVFLAPAPGIAGAFSTVDEMIGDADAVAVATPDGRRIYSKNEDVMLTPASTLKILTALVAFEHLGTAYRFPTDFYVDEENNLIVKGYGDPFLVSETVATIARHLAGSIDSVNHLVVDGSFFADASMPGTAENSIRSYDAPNGALCVNFNTVFFKTEKDGRLVSAEPQTPLLPTAVKRIREMQIPEGRVLFSSTSNETARYAGELFRYFLEASGVNVKGDIRMESANGGKASLVYRHYSDLDVTELVHRMMEYSNNFIANQLLLASGAAAYGPPAALEKGVRATLAYAETLSISPEIVEGSGISRKNRVTAEMMIAILDAFAPHSELLQKRGRIFYKTGTLSGIQSRAGYIEGKDGVLYRFVVMLNTDGALADPIVDRIAAALVKKGGRP